MYIFKNIVYICDTAKKKKIFKSIAKPATSNINNQSSNALIDKDTAETAVSYDDFSWKSASRSLLSQLPDSLVSPQDLWLCWQVFSSLSYVIISALISFKSVY